MPNTTLNPTRVVITSYSNVSESALALKQAFIDAGIPCIMTKTQNSRFTPREGDLMINWGCTGERVPQRSLNAIGGVQSASNKRSALGCLATFRIAHPEFCTTREEAQTMLDNGYIVVARAILNGNSGEGITLHGGEYTDPLPNVPLYTRYLPKTDEYRIHIVKGNVILCQRKALRSDFEGTPNWRIRNLDNGFIFEQNNPDTVFPECVIQQALGAVHALGLDFGAVDVVYHRTFNTAHVLEVNTAPGMSGTTPQKYVEAFLGEAVPYQGIPEVDRLQNHVGALQQQIRSLERTIRNQPDNQE